MQIKKTQNEGIMYFNWRRHMHHVNIANTSYSQRKFYMFKSPSFVSIY